jgi:hypothetical protein
VAKTLEQHFADWESSAFGYGYGTGEPYTLAALKGFFSALGKGPDRPNVYHYTDLEKALTPTVAWLMINTLCHEDIIEYGTSPRGGWLTFDQGVALKAFVDTKTVDELIEICCSSDENTVHCYPDHCNCDEDAPCQNPFWRKRRT